ncbi:MAG: adenylate/guanylate cyclase domain-containing protein [Myxococcota bacterium]
MAVRVRLRFRTKIWAVLCGFVFAALAIALVVAQDMTLDRAREEARARFDRTLVAFSELQRLRSALLAETIDALTRTNPQLRTILSTATLAGTDLGVGPAPTQDALRDANLRLQSALPSLALHHRQVIFAVASAQGQLLYSKADPERYGQDLSQLELVRAIGAHGSAAALWLDTDARVEGARLAPAYPSPALYLVRGEPVVFGEEIHGQVIAGEPIDRALLSSLRAISGVDLALLVGSRVLATTLSVGDAARLGAKLDAFGDRSPASAGGGMVELSLGGERYLALRAEVVPGRPTAEAGFVLLSSLDAALAGFRDLRQTLIGVGLGILAAALGLGFLLARGITRPLATLARAARRVGAGEFETRVEIGTGDELEALGAAFNEMASGLAERELIKQTLERYVSKGVAAELLRAPGRAALAGVRRELTVLFVDLGGFTELAEELEPEAVVAHLNEYFEAVCGAVLEHDGTVKEFQGDGVVAFWGAPIEQPDHAPRACRAALAASIRLDALCARWSERGVLAPRYRMGLHTAELVAGEIGSVERGTYGVVGDGMNLASRLEGANKAYGTRVLISEATRARAGEGFVTRELDTVRVLGRRAEVRIFELVGLAGEVDARTLNVLAHYAEALAAYRARDWDASARALARLLQLAPDDAPARMLQARGSAYGADPPPSDWDGVFALDAK